MPAAELLPLQDQFIGENIILADGDFPQNSYLLDLLSRASYVVCCDGASQKLLDFGRMPSAVIGDLDSISPELRRKLRSITYFVADQNNNDLCKAFNLCLSCYVPELTILGATGQREDHSLGNIFQLADFAQKLPLVRILSDYGAFYCIRDEAVLRVKPQQAISIFALTPNTRISSEGLVWNLDKVKFTNLYCATLNRVQDNCQQIYLRTSESVLIYLAS